MSVPLRLLLIEDSENDAALLVRALRRGGYADLTYARVETAETMRAALAGQPWDLVISDYSMPQFSGPAALQLLLEVGIDLPFIVVSGTVGEETAVAAMKAGAHDFLMKNNLARLIPAVTRELGEAAERRERRRAGVAHRAAEARLAGILDATSEAIIAVDAAQRIVLFNSSAERIFGYSAAEALGQSLDILVPPQLIEAHHQHIRAFAATPARSRGLNGRNGEFAGRRKDGSEFPIEASIAKLSEAGQTVFTVFVQDISARKQLEAQFLQSQKIEAVGRLAGGIAHDFNNLLTVIAGYADLLLSDLEGDPRRGDIAEIQKAADRAAALTRQLLSFSRKQILAPRVLDLNTAVASMDKLLQRLIGEDIDLVTILAPALGHVKADPGQFEQVIMNLAVNARDAMPQGGKLTIETANADLDAEYDRQHLAVSPGSYVMLAVSDTGCGMDRETQSHLFEPFFTTKDQGKGTGLGLSTVYGIITQSEGTIWVYSELGQGTTFKIYLPRVEAAIDQEELHIGVADLPAESATILLVEDEPMVRTLARRILDQHGYTVLEAPRGAEAMVIAEQHAGPIHMLLTDVVMPEMSGHTLAQQLTVLRPGIQVLYISGYTDGAIVRHGVLAADVIFLQKPFTPNDLVRKVRQVLGAEQR
jgi:two-component system cell cycle sensor histidine kinase/response regulator CckA